MAEQIPASSLALVEASSDDTPVVVKPDGSLRRVPNQFASLSSPDAGKGAALVQYKISGVASAVSRTVEAKLRETVSVRDFGAKGDNTTDDTAAVQACLTYCQGSGAVMFVPSGQYKVGDLTVNGTMSTGGVDILGEHVGHVGPGAIGATFIYTGTGICLSINAGGGVGYHYRTNIRNVGFWAPSTGCTALIYAKNLQECTFENVSVNGTSDSLTLVNGFLFDSAGIVNLDNCCITRCTNGVHFSAATGVNSSGGFNLTRCNIYLNKNAVNMGLMDSFNAEANWIEGFETAFLFDNASPNTRIQSLHTMIENNVVIQSITGWTQARFVRVKNSTNANPIILHGVIRANQCYMNSSGASTPAYAVEVNIAGNTASPDVRLVIEDNDFWGVGTAGIHCDSTAVVVHTARNDTRASWYGAPIANRTASFYPLRQPAVLFTLNAPVAAPSSTSESIVATVPVPKNLMGKAGTLRVSAGFLLAGGGSKTLKLRLGGTQVASYDAGTATAATINATISNQNATNAQYAVVNAAGNGTPQVQLFAAAVDTSAATDLTVTVTKGVAADGVELKMLVVEIIPE